MKDGPVPGKELPVSGQWAEKDEVLWPGFSPGYFLALYHAI